MVTSQTGNLSFLSRLLMEAVAIFIGVAAALAGQAWFEARTERVAEREFLENVLEQLVTIESTDSATAATFEQQRRTAVMLAGLLSRVPTAATADSIMDTAPLLSVYDQGVGYSAVDVLLAPESVRLVRDALLRSRLGTFRASVGDIRGTLQQNADFALSEWRAVGLQNFNFRVPGGFWSSEPDLPPVSRHKRDGTRLAASPEFENLVDLSVAQYRNVLTSVEETAAMTPELRALIHERLKAL